MIKKWDLYAYSFQMWVHVEYILMKLHVCIFVIKEEKGFDKYIEILEKVNNIIQKNW